MLEANPEREHHEHQLAGFGLGCWKRTPEREHHEHQLGGFGRFWARVLEANPRTRAS